MRTDQDTVVMLDAASNKNTSNTCCVVSSSSSDPFLSSSVNGVATTNTSNQKRKRRPAGTPGNNKGITTTENLILKFQFFFGFCFISLLYQFDVMSLLEFSCFSLNPIEHTHTHTHLVFNVLIIDIFL